MLQTTVWIEEKISIGSEHIPSHDVYAFRSNQKKQDWLILSSCLKGRIPSSQPQTIYSTASLPHQTTLWMKMCCCRYLLSKKASKPALLHQHQNLQQTLETWYFSSEQFHHCIIHTTYTGLSLTPLLWKNKMKINTVKDSFVCIRWEHCLYFLAQNVSFHSMFVDYQVRWAVFEP